VLYGGPCSVAIAPNGFSKREPPRISRVGLYRANGGAYALEVADRLAEATGAELQRFRPPGDEPDAIEDPADIEVDLLVLDSASYAPLRQVMLDERAEWVIGHVRCPVLITPRLPSP
jgi:nucleotide-binding universal stress UspA family protein